MHFFVPIALLQGVWCSDLSNTERTEKLKKVVMKKFKLSGHTALRSIQAGKVKVDGEVVTVGGAFVSENQRIEFQKPPLVVYALNKPVGVLSKPEANDNPTVLEFLPPGDLSVSGRLDKDSSGLIVASNDGR